MKDELENIKKYLKEKSVLIITESGTDRTAWKKLFVEMGVMVTNFHNAGSIEESYIPLGSHLSLFPFQNELGRFLEGGAQNPK